MAPDFQRLPTEVKPQSYRITLKPNLETFLFEGQVEANLVVEAPVSEIRLNVNELEVQTVVVSQNETQVSVESFDIFEDNETMVVKLSQPLATNSQAKLVISYIGKHDDTMRGFYRTLQGQDGNKKLYGAVCHFEPTGARKAFPCWDEPKFRATFDMILILPKGHDFVALSNMPERRRIEEDQFERIEFETTPSMPSYLVCVSIGYYDHLQTTNKDNVLVRVFTPKGKSEHGSYALEIGTKALDYFKEFFGVEYKLPKMDMIALSDFSSGAMENWGLITFKEELLLYDPNTSSKVIQQKAATIVSHEVAHQWFGNLVTVDWWSHLWLKEGYATWIQNLCTDYISPQWNVWTLFLSSTLNPALELDSLENSHPIQVEVNDPHEIDEIFDLISYNKGSSVIRMLYNWIGQDAFRNGMKQYLLKHAFSTAETEDLWDALEGASGQPVRRVMSTWTKQKGYPILSYKVLSHSDAIELEIKQTPFLSNSKLVNEDYESSLWGIPLTISNKTGQVLSRTVMTGATEKVTLSRDIFDESKDWINLNPHCVGYFRVHYPMNFKEYGLERITEDIKQRTLGVHERLSILNDQMALVTAGRTSAMELISLMANYQNEDSYVVWTAVVACLKQLRKLVCDCDSSTMVFNEWVKKFLAPGMKRLGGVYPRPNEDYYDSLCRAILVTQLVKAGDDGVIDECQKRFQEHMSHQAVIEPDLKIPVYTAVMKKDPQTAFVTLVNVARTSQSSEERDRVYASFGGAENVEVLTQILEFSLSHEVRNQDIPDIFGTVAFGSRNGRDLAWNFFKQNLSEFDDRFKKGGSTYSRLVKYVISNYGSLEAANEIETYFAQNSLTFATRAISQGLEKIRLIGEWRKRDLERTMEFAKSQLTNSDLF